MTGQTQHKTKTGNQESVLRYEQELCITQDLSFGEAESCFNMHHSALTPEKMRALGLKGKNGNYTNLALLLSDQCVHTMKLTVFQGTGTGILQEYTELHGSLLTQLKEAYAILDRLNRKQIVFSGLTQNEQRSYPAEAIREGLMNAVLHREYRYKDATLINIHEDRIEFVTLGGLPEGITINDLNLGISVLRNPGLAQVFAQLQMLGGFGTGIRAIRDAYAEGYQTPAFDASDHAFRLILPNRNYKTEKPFSHLSPPYQKQQDDREKRIVELTRKKGYISRKDIESELHVSQSMAILILRKMTEKGLLIKEGAGKNRLYWAR
ncbi:MAG: Crp/Fnr family transcriptional regulator [Solobacterium sp.]|nr:Crp/Fnr family transcriptional regulator [Solobacterium sp.]